MALQLEFRTMSSVDETLANLDQLGSDATLIAGGTDVMMQLRRRELTPAVLLSIDRLDDLRPITPGVAEDADTSSPVRVGALTRHTDICTAGPIKRGYRGISRASAQVGGWQTQAIGTVIGNVVNASPAADLVPPLLVHGAVVHLRDARDERAVPLQEFIVDRRRTVRRADEMVTAISLEPVPEMTADEFVKVGRRSAMEVSIVAVAARITLDPSSGTVADARIAVGSCGPVAYRASEAEQLLIGAAPHRSALAAAARAATEPADPIDDVRGSRAYRLRVLPRAVEKVLAEAAGRARQRMEGAA